MTPELILALIATQLFAIIAILCFVARRLDRLNKPKDKHGDMLEIESVSTEYEWFKAVEYGDHIQKLGCNVGVFYNECTIENAGGGKLLIGFHEFYTRNELAYDDVRYSEQHEQGKVNKYTMFYPNQIEKVEYKDNGKKNVK